MNQGKMQISELEERMMQGMQLCRDVMVTNFGIAKSLPDKNSINLAGQALTEVDLSNQETFLVHLHQFFPNVEISVEERVDDPTEVQQKFYKNQGKSDICVTLDALDGSHNYKYGIRKDYGMIGSIVKKIDEKTGKFVSAIMYYPTDDFFLVANTAGMFEFKGKSLHKLVKPNKLICQREEYSAVFSHDAKRLQLAFDRFVTDIYSINQMLVQLINGEIPGFLTSNGHIYDHIVGQWMARQWGADMEYASGVPFDAIPFGDKIVEGKRISPRDNKGLLIAGDRKHPIFQEYINKRIII